jgi:GWxTD domain-containing protein
MTITQLFMLSWFMFAPADETETTAVDNLNLNYQYNLQAEVQCQYQLARADNKAMLFLAISIPEAASLGEYTFDLHLRENYQSRLIQENFDLGFPAFAKESVYYFKKEVNLQHNSGLLMLKVSDPEQQKSFYFDFPLSKGKQSDLLLFKPESDFPVLDNFVAKGQALELRSWYGGEKLVHVFHYDEQFEAARPPMQVKHTAKQQELQPNHRSLSLDNSTGHFQQQGLYFLQKDSSSTEGFSFMMLDHGFPKYNQVETLVGPLKYLSSDEEFQKVMTASKKKQAFDRQWINMASSSGRARRIIQSYYQQVTKANILFTHYKEGWKTDQGIIYIFLGPPDEVYRNDEQEEWIYHENDNFSKIKFTFARINNLFTSRHYQLQRDQRYAPTWHRIVDLWRKGRILL